MNLDLLRKELEEDEGRRKVPYRDTLGFWTCGIGHKMDRPPFQGERWTDEQIDHKFELDINEALADVAGEPWWEVLDLDRRQRAVMNMVFNLGKTRLMKFHYFLHLLTTKRFKEAGEDLRSTLWHRQVPARAERIIRLLT